MALPFPEIDPVAFAIGPVEIRWYALAYLAGFLLGWQFSLFIAGMDRGRTRPNRTDIDDYLPWAVLSVILGGRIGYILFYQLDMYLTYPSEIFKLWHGGMSFHGGVVGVIAGMAIYAAIRKISFLRLSDIVCCAVPIGLFFGRLANFVNGELFGRVTEVSWAVIFPGGGGQARHPSQLYEATFEGLILFGILFTLLRRTTIRQRPGLLSAVFLGGYGLFRAGIEFFREPDMQIGLIFGFISMGQILCLPMLIGAGILAVYALRAPATQPEPPLVPGGTQ